MERSAIRDGLPPHTRIPDCAALHPGYRQIVTYFAGAFGISAFSFSMSLMFIFIPPGIMMSPAF